MALGEVNNISYNYVNLHWKGFENRLEILKKKMLH